MRALMAGLFSLAAMAASAEPVVYDCRVQPRTYFTDSFGPFENRIQPVMRITVDGDRAEIDDAYIRAVFGGPIDGTVTLDSPAKLVVTWDTFERGFAGAQSRMHFRAAFLKKPNKMIVTQTAGSSTNRFHGRGVCRWPGMGQG